MILFAPAAVADIERLRLFLDDKNPGAAKRAMLAINAALERLLEFGQLGALTDDPEIRQIIIRFGDAGYVARYSILPTGDILVLRIWHGRETRG